MMKPLRIYILGPMRGIPLYNFPAFDAARDRLRAMGHIPVSPADIDRSRGLDPDGFPDGWDWTRLPAGTDLRDIIERDLAALRSCQGFCCLRGWQASIGANAERAMARWYGLTEFVLPQHEEEAVVAKATGGA